MTSAGSAVPALQDDPMVVSLIDRFTARWNDSEAVEESTLLRLAILRDLMRDFHAERSVLLSTGRKQEAQNFRAWESRIEALRGAASLEGSLMDNLTSQAPVKKRTRLLPEAVLNLVDKEKFERYDRQWENVIAAEAASLGWRFWNLTAWLEISMAEKWQRSLNEKLTPHGIVLFAESGENAQSAATSNLWQGQWLVVLKPRYLTPDFHVRSLPGVSLEPSPPAWKLIYSPKKR